MKAHTFLKTSFILMLFGILLTAWLKWNFIDFRELPVFILAFFLSIPFMVTAIVELNESTRIDRKEKTMWTFGFIAIPLVTGILYFVSERKKALSA